MTSFGDYTPSAPVVTEGYLVKPEVRVNIGKTGWTTSLDFNSYSYNYNDVPVGFEDSTKYFEVGLLASMGQVLSKTFEAVDSANAPRGTIFDMTDEELTLSFEAKELNPLLVELLLHTTPFENEDGSEKVFATGGGCDMISRPITVEWTNVDCHVIDTADIDSGITGGILTVYKAIVTNGFDWGTMVRNGENNIPVEITALPINTFPAGRRLASLWLY